MLTEYEASKLRCDMADELDDARGALLKSAAGLLLVVLLALFGPLLLPGHANAASGPAAAPGAMELRL